MDAKIDEFRSMESQVMSSIYRFVDLLRGRVNVALSVKSGGAPGNYSRVYVRPGY